MEPRTDAPQTRSGDGLHARVYDEGAAYAGGDCALSAACGLCDCGRPKRWPVPAHFYVFI